jgi:lysophospholipase L1-like esterase
MSGATLNRAIAGVPRKAALTIGWFVVFAALVRWVPERLHPPAAEVKVAPALAKEQLRGAPPPNLTVPPGSLDTFFSSLHRGKVTRVLHYGDSPTTADSITSDVRQLLQERFGDAGHGFLLIARPWAWYGHRGVTLEGHGWKIEPASQARAADGIHGLGGVSFRGEAGAASTVTLPDDRHTGAVVYYLKQPGGGSFEVSSGKTPLLQVNTESDEKVPGFAEFALPPGTRTIELRVTEGKVRLFGYRFDKDGPGVQYSSLGVNGAQVQMIVRFFETKQWAAALRHEDPDLVVLNYGTNESIYPAYIEKQYPDELRTVITRMREALPKASILVMSPMDRGVMQAGEIVTPPALAELVDVEQRIAAETGCAFFNTWQAMGGAGTMGRWYHETPRLVSADFMHPLPQGAARVGELLEDALMQAYEAKP